MTNQPRVYQIPARQAGDCRKQLYLRLTDVQPSDHTENDQTRNRMAALLAMKPVVNRALRQEGWETRPVPPVPDIPVSDTLNISVFGDLVMRHPDITNGRWIAAVTASAKERTVRDWLTATSAYIRPWQLHRLALITEALRAAPEPPCEIDPDQPQMIAMLDYDNGALEYEPNETDYLERIAASLKERLQPLDQALQTGQMPEPDYTPDSAQCRRCPYLQLCHGVPATPATDDQSVSEEEFQQAVRTFAAAETRLLPLKDISKQRDDAKNIVKRYMTQNGYQWMTLDADDSRWDARIRTSQRTNLSVTQARKLLTAEQLAGIASVSPQTALYITPADE